MRYSAVGVLVAAALGTHCSAQTGDETTSSAPEMVTAPPPPAGGRGPVIRESEEVESPFKSSIPSLAALVHAGIAPLVTSTVRDEAGGQYVTGTFMGTVAIGRSTITSRGDKDVFLLKLDAKGGFQWVRAVGSTSAEHSPRVTLSLEKNRVTLVGITAGEMDCGAGPMAPWDSETFFLCLFAGNDGASKGSGVFPTGSP